MVARFSIQIMHKPMYDGRGWWSWRDAFCNGSDVSVTCWGMVSVIMSPAALSTHDSTHDSSALGDCSVAGTKVSCYTITTISVNTAGFWYDFVACNNSVPVEVG